MPRPPHLLISDCSPEEHYDDLLLMATTPKWKDKMDEYSEEAHYYHVAVSLIKKEPKALLLLYRLIVLRVLQLSEQDFMQGHLPDIKVVNAYVEQLQDEYLKMRWKSFKEKYAYYFASRDFGFI